MPFVAAARQAHGEPATERIAPSTSAIFVTIFMLVSLMWPTVNEMSRWVFAGMSTGTLVDKVDKAEAHSVRPRPHSPH